MKIEAKKGVKKVEIGESRGKKVVNPRQGGGEEKGDGRGGQGPGPPTHPERTRIEGGTTTQHRGILPTRVYVGGKRSRGRPACKGLKVGGRK